MNVVLVRRGIPMMVLTLAVCVGAIALARVVGRTLRLGAPVLIYGYADGYGSGDIAAYDYRRQEARALFSGAIRPDSNFFWSPDRDAALRVALDQATPPEETAFVLALYPNWGSEAVSLPGRFDGYSTPAWAPDGRSVIVPACQITPPDIVCATYVFYRVDVANPRLLPIDLPALADLPRAWEWLDDHTLRVWQAERLLDLDLNTNATVTLFDGLPPQPRAVRWVEDFSRLAYYTSTEEPFCLYVLVVAEGETQTVSCDAIDVNAPFGWLADGRTVYYARGADREIRLYDSATHSDRSAADPPVQLDWPLDTLYPVPETSLLMHHATFGGTTTTVIDTATGQVRAWDVRLAAPTTDGRFVPSPEGWPVAILRDDDEGLGLLWPDQSEVLWLHPRACCTLAWTE